MLLALTALTATLAGGGAMAAEPADGDAYRVDTLIDGVHVFRPVQPSIARTNSLVVEQDDGLLVVEAQPSIEAATELLAAIARFRSAPVRYLVLSHPHAESAGGASAFPEETLVIGSAGCHLEMAEGKNFGAEMRETSDSPDSWIEPPKRLPRLVVRSMTTLEDSRNPVDLRPMQHGHSRGDLIVLVRGAEVVYAGALLFPENNPYIRDGSVRGWIGVLNYFASERHQRLIPLRGPELGHMQVRRLRDSINWLRGQVALGFLERKTHEEIPRWVLENEELSEHFATRDLFLEQLLDRILFDLVQERRKRDPK